MMIYYYKYNQEIAPAATAVPNVVPLLKLMNTVLNMWCVIIYFVEVFFYHQKEDLETIHTHISQTTVYIHRLAPRIC